MSAHASYLLFSPTREYNVSFRWVRNRGILQRVCDTVRCLYNVHSYFYFSGGPCIPVHQFERGSVFLLYDHRYNISRKKKKTCLNSIMVPYKMTNAIGVHQPRGQATFQ
jgi:hypothetical protein